MMSLGNTDLRRTVVMLEKAAREHKVAIWQKASRDLAKPATMKVEVNVGRISRIAGSGAKLFVPGKVLGSGLVDKKLVVGAFSFSASAKEKIESSGGAALSVEQFLKKYPKGSGVTIVE